MKNISSCYSEFEIMALTEGFEPGDTLDIEHMSSGDRHLFVLKSYDSDGVYLTDVNGKTCVFNPDTLISKDRNKKLVITGLSDETLRIKKKSV